MARLKWMKLREATAVADAPALLRSAATADPDEDGDIDTGGELDGGATPCPSCQGTGVKGAGLCSRCDGAGTLVKESTRGDYWLYSDDPEWEQLREADHPEWEQLQEAPRTFSSDVRKKYAAGGAALPDGSYPIPDKDGLRRAVASYGRNPTAAVKAHIVKRARALDASDQLPDDWNGQTKEADTSLEERLEALEQSAAADKQSLKQLREARPGAMTPTFSTPTRVKTSHGQEGYQVTLIREGRGNSDQDQWYTGEAIRELCESGYCEGMQAFGNHPSMSEEEDRPERDVKELVGTYHDTKFAESGGKARADAIFVPLTLDESHPSLGWVVTLAEAAVKSTAPQPICGISLYGLSAGDDCERPDGTYGRMVSMIRPSSGDIVTNAGAGGGFIRQLMESARALRNRSRKELTPMKAMAYQSAVREAAKRVREATTDEERTEALEALSTVEAEKIDNVPDSIEQLREAAPALVQEIEAGAKAEDGKTIEELREENGQLRDTLGKFNNAIEVTDALREAGVEDPVELRHYAGLAQLRGLREASAIKEMVEAEQAFDEHRRQKDVEALRESFNFDEDVEIEGAVPRVPTSSLPTDGGLTTLRESGIPVLETAE